MIPVAIEIFDGNHIFMSFAPFPLRLVQRHGQVSVPHIDIHENIRQEQFFGFMFIMLRAPSSALAVQNNRRRGRRREQDNY
jgi:hypothetical protein